jgi:flagellar hook assembly protein FlgD
MKEKAVLDPFSFNGTDEIQYCKIASEYSGSQLNIRIFDTFGNEVNYLVKNQILGNRDEISWNGKQDNGSNLEKGHYIWWIEILQANGVRTILKLLSNLE